MKQVDEGLFPMTIFPGIPAERSYAIGVAAKEIDAALAGTATIEPSATFGLYVIGCVDTGSALRPPIITKHPSSIS